MRRLAGLLVSLSLLGCTPSSGYVPRDGDIVFHTSRSAQSLAIQLATKSPYSHMGIVYLRDGKPFVFEAVQPVKLTPLTEWIARGERQQFVAKRLRDADTRLTADGLGRAACICRNRPTRSNSSSPGAVSGGRSSRTWARGILAGVLPADRRCSISTTAGF